MHGDHVLAANSGFLTEQDGECAHQNEDWFKTSHNNITCCIEM